MIKELPVQMIKIFIVLFGFLKIVFDLALKNWFKILCLLILIYFGFAAIGKTSVKESAPEQSTQDFWGQFEEAPAEAYNAEIEHVEPAVKIKRNDKKTQFVPTRNYNYDTYTYSPPKFEHNNTAVKDNSMSQTDYNSLYAPKNDGVHFYIPLTNRDFVRDDGQLNILY